MSVEGDLRQSMDEEDTAAQAYRSRAISARLEGDEVSAELLEHIAEEEHGHYIEFMVRASVLRRQGQLPSFQDYASMESMGHPIAPRSHEFEPVMLGSQHGWRCKVCGYEEIVSFFGKTPPCKGPKVVEAVGHRTFPQTYGDWVNLAEDIKAKYPDDLMSRSLVNYQLHQIAGETKDAAEAKRWLLQKAAELGIS